MAAPTRYPSGLSTQPKTNPLGNYVAPDPTRVHTYFTDFDTYDATQWTITVVQAGAGDASEALTTGDGGILLITNDAADDDSVFFNKVGSSFLMESGKQAWFKTRLKVSDATQSDVVVGLQVTDTTPLSVSDGIYFLKTDGAATIDVICRKNSSTGSTSATAIASMVSDTYITLAWYYDGVSSVAYYVNDVQLGTLDGSSSFLPDTTLTVSFGVQNGEAVAKTLSVDYIMAAKERG
jgi:hypothetical protein